MRPTRTRGRSDRHGRLYGRDVVALLTAAQAAAHDAYAREQAGVPQRVLMENAGRAAAHVIHHLYPEGRIVGVAGSGNNGGDALVALRVLQSWGRDVAIIHAGARAPDAVLHHAHDVPVIESSAADHAFAAAAVIVDGLLGTGATGAPRLDAAEWIRRITHSGAPVVALDLPSGIDATTGGVHDPALRAQVTITFGYPKTGLLLNPARSNCGRIIAVEIGFPPLTDYNAELITPLWAIARLPARAPDAHKSAAGRLFILAGQYGMAGAAILAATAAQRAGAGLVRIASVADNRVILQVAVPEATYSDAADIHQDAVAGCTAIVAGPGLGTGDDARTALERVLALTPGVPALLDADALNLLAGDDDALRSIAGARPLLITPHPGELGRLLQSDVANITRDPLRAARAAADRFGCTVLLKGQPSVVAQTDAPTLVAANGSSDLATAGMGDHLAGVAGAFLAAGCSPRDAAGVALHYSGQAALLARRGRALSPRDVTDALGRAFARPGALAPPTGMPFVTFDQPARW